MEEQQQGSDTTGGSNTPPPLPSTAENTPSTTQQHTCPDGSTPDSNGNCPTTPAENSGTTTTTPPPAANQQQTTCPDGSTPDSNGNCPTSTTTTQQNAFPQTLTNPTPPGTKECVNGEGGEVYLDFSTYRCIPADIPKSDGSCITGYQKSAADSTLCEPIDFHCPAGKHAILSTSRAPKCESNDVYMGNGQGRFNLGNYYCAPGYHFAVNSLVCVPDQKPASTTPAGNTGKTGGTTNTPAAQDGHILVMSNPDGTCPTGSHKFGAVCEKDTTTTKFGG